MAREGEWENISSCAIVGVGSDDAGLGVSTTQCLGSSGNRSDQCVSLSEVDGLMSGTTACMDLTTLYN